jgi:sarcosine oxidase subunit beta
VDVEWLSPEGVAAMAPFVRLEGLRAGTFCAGDGIIDPHGVVSALGENARRLGVSMLCDTDVVEISGGGGGVMVGTTRGDIDAEFVVNAAGAHAASLAALAGVDLPVAPRRRNIACTQAVGGAPETTPMCVDMDTGVLIRREGGGFLIAYSNPDEPSGFETSFDPTFLDAVGARIANRFPFLAEVPIDSRKCWAGLYPETPDHHAIIDAPPAAPWFIQCAGFGGHGIMHSLAAGQAVTELITGGQCTTFDLGPLRLSRFATPGSAVETAVL